MRVNREQMRANRERILSEAGRLFRERGFENVGVAEVMRAAGMTHGGFYGHFASKDDLVMQTLTQLFAPRDAASDPAMTDFLDVYLSPEHRDSPGTGCPTAALSVDAARQTEAARRSLSAGIEAQIARMAARLGDEAGGHNRVAATGIWAAMVGALVLARAADAPLSDRILADAKAWIAGRLDAPGDT
ncbi:TetR family transcriptional regulator [Sphingomonas ginsenosidimutans]|uniref:TetR family transcriptional regulator n=1 Tax=Sphingomonas ginsenosidimutans TaxID=862134 RepID=A0A2A4I253_9SPHN|nr:TetR/AcrR family transcriptional regulator [Sphingomonas ginsenosidimutans]PCG10846.1 TetR family transcriptional regulator [Sphingomonas ginsenosidimutans]